MKEMIESRGYSEAEAALYLGISRGSLRVGRMEVKPSHFKMTTPPFVKLGKKVLYLKDDLDRWLEDNRRTN